MVNVKHLAADGATVITQQVWSTLVSTAVDVDSVRLKFGVENVSTRALGASPLSALLLTIEQIGTNDGWTFMRSALDSATLSKPYGDGLDANGLPNGSPTVTLSSAGAGGVWAATGTYGVVITAINNTGETIASVEQQFTIDVTTKKATYAWKQIAGATGYKVYRTSTPGTYGANSLRASIGNGATVTYQDDGSATGAGSPPSTNTTAGAGPTYGTPPAYSAFDNTDKTVAVAPNGLAVGQQWFYWMEIHVPLNTSEAGNTRASRRRFKEV